MNEPQRSPFSLVEVRPNEDRRASKEAIDKRVQGHVSHSQGDSGQLFHNNALREHPVTEAHDTDPDRLFSSENNPPNFAIMEEKAEHRFIVYLKAQGLSNKEVADKTGYTQPWISQITRQPWFKLRLVQELKDAGVDAVQCAIKMSALDSVFTLVDLRDDLTSPKAVRKAACDSLLDRFLGKAPQKVELDQKSVPSTPEIRELDAEIRKAEEAVREAHGT